MPKISVVVPVYNVEKYLDDCLMSLVNQTLLDIEIICVDDGSTDSSSTILSRYASNDIRMKVITFPVNRSLIQARKAGVLAATGKYLMFVDSDDYIELDACENLYKRIETLDVDILQFGTYINPLQTMSMEAVDWFQNYVEPFKDFLYAKKILSKCFRENKLSWNVWNRIYKSNIVKLAFAEVDDNYRLVLCEDMYISFFILWYAERYYGIDDKFYHYRYGAGFSALNSYTLEQYIDNCARSEIIKRWSSFLINHNDFKQWSDVLNKYKLLYMDSSFEALFNLSDKNDGSIAIKQYINSYDDSWEYVYLKLSQLRDDNSHLNKRHSLLCEQRKKYDEEKSLLISEIEEKVQVFKELECKKALLDEKLEEKTRIILYLERELNLSSLNKQQVDNELQKIRCCREYKLALKLYRLRDYLKGILRI